MTTLYEPAERALLSDFLGLPRSGDCQSADISHLLADIDLDTDTVLKNAVARWAISVIQSRLPQTGIVHADGRVDLTRAGITKPHRDIVLLPQHLFMINWADTAPGISWPEDYYVIFLPGFERYLVTASQDSTDAWGVTDLAIGSFPASTAIPEGCRQVITEWWRSQANGWDQERFAYVWGEGLIDSDTANAWADEVWVTEVEEDEDA
jgi:hypothetical protein